MFNKLFENAYFRSIIASLTEYLFSNPITFLIFLEEICLTYPGLSVKIKRPQHIRVRFTMANGETVTKQFTGMTARIFQQQLDHLNGIIFYSRANLYHREQALKKWKNGENFEIRIKT